MFPASMDSGCGSDPPHRRRWTLPRAAQGGRAKAGAADPRTSSQRRLVATAALLARRLAEGAAAAAAARSWTEAPLSKRGSAQCSAALGWHGRAALPAFAAVLRGGRRRPGAGRGGLLPCRAGRPSRLVLPPPHSRVSAAVATLHLSFRTPSLSPPSPHPHTPPMAVLRTYSSVTRAPGEVRGGEGHGRRSGKQAVGRFWRSIGADVSAAPRLLLPRVWGYEAQSRQGLPVLRSGTAATGPRAFAAFLHGLGSNPCRSGVPIPVHHIELYYN